MNLGKDRGQSAGFSALVGGCHTESQVWDLGPGRCRATAAGVQWQVASVSTCQGWPPGTRIGLGCDSETEKVSDDNLALSLE